MPGFFGAGCDSSVPLHLHHKSWQAVNPCQHSGTRPQGGQWFRPEAAKTRIMFFTGTISLRDTNKTLEQGLLALQHVRAALIQPDPCRDNSGHKPLAGQILPAEFCS